VGQVPVACVVSPRPVIAKAVKEIVLE